MRKLSTAGLAVALFTSLWAGENIDLEVVNRIKAEGLHNSKISEIMSGLTDVHGPRLTGSPGLRAASEWTRDQLTNWGLVNANLEAWGEFGPGWSLEKHYLAMTKPYYAPIISFPQAWTSGTDGVVRGAPVLISVNSVADLDQYKGKLKDAIVMVASTREAQTHFTADARRRSEEDLEELSQAPEPGAGPGNREERRRRWREYAKTRRETAKMLREEGVKAVLVASRGEHGTLFVSGSRPSEDAPPNLPTITVAVESFNQIQRLLERKVPVEIELEVKTRFHDQDLQAYNVVAEIPGTDPQLKDELVMLGGHIDSWHAGTGATDNASGVAVAMEAVRILKAIGVQPRRTIRIALWSGEEQGLLGSRAYVEKHFAEPKTMALKPDHSRFSAYFNLDNGTGKIRGVYLQENDAVRPIFQAFLEPFNNMGANTLSIRNTGGTDHLAFDRVGLPGFQFIQDPIDYSTRTHHTNMDVYDHALPGDLMQASVVMASFVYHTAMRDEKLPRKPLPQPEEQPEAAAAPVAASQ